MKKILYVEDDLINALVIQRLLKAHFQVTHCLDGETCLSLLSRESFDLILMDINLGRDKMDGVEALHQIRANPLISKAIVICVTSYALPEDENRFLREGFDAYLSKPVDRDLLLKAINQYLK
jgi:two-component system, cell cycle response regulator DivK